MRQPRTQLEERIEASETPKVLVITKNAEASCSTGIDSAWDAPSEPRLTFAAAAASTVSTTNTALVTPNATRATAGHSAKLRRHQGSGARRASASSTRDSSVAGA